MQINITITTELEKALVVAKHYGFNKEEFTEEELVEFCQTELKNMIINAISIPSQQAINENIENQRREEMDKMKNSLAEVVEINIL